MNKTGKDFKQAALKLKLKKWEVHRCTLCNYPCGYIFSPDYEHVSYDSGCNCVGYENLNDRSWDDVANQYNRITSRDYLNDMNELWGFEEA